MSLQTLSGKQIRSSSLEDRHIKGKLSESVINIDWTSSDHAEALLKNKSVMDYVKSDNLIVATANASQIDIELPLNQASVTIPGVQLNSKLRLRDVNGEPIHCDGKEVIAKIITCNGEVTPGDPDTKYGYTVGFYKHDGSRYEFPMSTNLEFLYPIKANLWDINENIVTNEFDDNSALIKARLDLEQIAKDIFGFAYNLNGDGNNTLSESILSAVNNLKKAQSDTRTHVHGSHAFRVMAETTVVQLEDIQDFPLSIGDLKYNRDQLEVYYNGNLQAENMHYTVMVDLNNSITGIDFSPDVILKEDIVIIKWAKYNF